MDENVKRITSALSAAVQTERDGQHFYRMALASMEDEKGREVFGLLAEEEKQHEKFLLAQHKSFTEEGKADPNAVLGSATEFSGDHPIFSEKILGRIGTAHNEMAALGVGIQLELASQNYYRIQAEEAPAMEVKVFFEALAEWESNHYHALLTQQESLKEHYWSKNGFAPF